MYSTLSLCLYWTRTLSMMSPFWRGGGGPQPRGTKRMRRKTDNSLCCSPIFVTKNVNTLFFRNNVYTYSYIYGPHPTTVRVPYYAKFNYQCFPVLLHMCLQPVYELLSINTHRLHFGGAARCGSTGEPESRDQRGLSQIKDSQTIARHNTI